MKKNWLWIMICVVFIPLLMGFFGSLNWILDVFSHFRVYYCTAFFLIGIIALILKKWKESGVSLILSSILLLSFVDLYLPVKESHSSAGLSIASINLLSSNNNFEEVIGFIKSNNFDVIFFQELNTKWEGELEILNDDFPTRAMFAREDNFGIGVISKINSAFVQEADFSSVNIPSLILTFPDNKEEVTIINTHPLPPVGSFYFNARNEQFEILNRIISKMDQQVVLIGDLNSTRFSPNFKRLLENGKLRDSRIGFGLLPTWHAQFPFISLTLDHAFVTDGIEVLDRRVGPDIGSDHLPVIIEVGW